MKNLLCFNLLELISKLNIITDNRWRIEVNEKNQTSNPKIFARANKELNKDLINLTEKYDDIELVLKAKPTII